LTKYYDDEDQQRGLRAYVGPFLVY